MLRLISVLGLVGLTVGAAMVSCGPRAGETNCNNQLDDDANGAVDCLDPACVSSSFCQALDGGGGGPGKKSCTKQEDCLVQSWVTDKPLLQCLSGTCEKTGEPIVVKFEVNTNAFIGWGGTFNSMSTRFVAKIAKDHTAVTCNTLKAAAPSKLEADANQLDKSGNFNYLSYEILPVSNGSPGATIQNPLLNTATGADWIVWNELWTGGVDSSTGQPKGTRAGWACIESGTVVAPLVQGDDCTGGSTTCRIVKVSMPGPN